jgi:hypothetical protein
MYQGVPEPLWQTFYKNTNHFWWRFLSLVQNYPKNSTESGEKAFTSLFATGAEVFCMVLQPNNNI